MQRFFMCDNGNLVSAVTPHEAQELLAAIGARSIPSLLLVENGARSTVPLVLRMLEVTGRDRRVTIAVGGGYTGAVGLALARHLAVHDVAVSVRRAEDPRSPATEEQLRALEATSVVAVDEIPSGDDRPALIVDALLGALPVDLAAEEALAVVAEIERWSAVVSPKSARPPVIALETPTGVDPHTGVAEPHHVVAAMTVSMGVPRTGLAVPAAGRLIVADIGVPPELFTIRNTVSHPVRFGDGHTIGIHPPV